MEVWIEIWIDKYKKDELKRFTVGPESGETINNINALVRCNSVNVFILFYFLLFIFIIFTSELISCFF